MTANDSLKHFTNLAQLSNEYASHLSTSIEDYLEKQALILEYLRKAKANLQVSLSEDFLEHKPEIIHDYLWSLSDRLEITTDMYEDLICGFKAIKELIA